MAVELRYRFPNGSGCELESLLEILPDATTTTILDDGIQISLFAEALESLEEERTELVSILHQLFAEPLPEPELIELEDDQWRDRWVSQLEPIEVGASFLICPVGSEPEAPLAREVITLDVRRGFGAGTHPTTQLMIEEIEDHLLSLSPAVRGQIRLLDVGCGSGILGLCALKLGIRRVLALDIDSGAVESAADNYQLNFQKSRTYAHLIPDAPIFEASLQPLEEVDTQYDVVCANILSGELLRMREELLRSLAPGAILLLSGILEEELDSFQRSFFLTDAAIRRKSGWVIISYQSKLT